MADNVFKACCGVKHPMAEIHDGVAEVRCPVCGRNVRFRVGRTDAGELYAQPYDAAAAVKEWNKGVRENG